MPLPSAQTTRRMGLTSDRGALRSLPWKLLVCLAAINVILLAACGQGSAGPTPTPPPSSATLREVTATAVPSATPTQAPTKKPVESPVPTKALPPTQATAPAATVLPSETPTQEATPVPTEPLTDRAAFVADVTAPDGSPYQINTTLVKTWRIKNVGTATWTTNYALTFVKGEAMTTTTTVPMSAVVEPGKTIDLTLNLVVPAKTGRMRGFWQLRNAAGAFFGVGPAANEPIYVDIFAVTDKVVSGPPIQVHSVTLSTANTAVSVPCPYDLILNGTLGFNPNGTGPVTAQLEATFSDPNFKFTAPGVAEFNFLGFESNPFPFAYTLTFVGNVEAQFRVHVLTPNDMRSDPVTFSLTCTSSAPPTSTPAPAP
jgi:hypothetical protein